jgi:hypothetical protein
MKVSPHTIKGIASIDKRSKEKMKVLHRNIKDKKHEMKILDRKIKDHQEKMRVLLKPNVQNCKK